jgi:hypothetical protein
MLLMDRLVLGKLSGARATLLGDCTLIGMKDWL